MKKNKGKGFMLMGLLLIAAAFFIVDYNMYEDEQAGETAEQTVRKLEPEIPEAGSAVSTSAEIVVPDYILNPDMEMPAITVDGKTYIGLLQIPVLELELPIISQWNDADLRAAPCRYSGSAYTDDLIIAGHNYISHFGGLNHLLEGDRLILTDTDGNVFSYRVDKKEILTSTAVRDMESGDWDLTLFTCTLGGQNRLTIRCKRTE